MKRNVIALSKEGYKALEQNLPDVAEENFGQILAVDPENSYALVGLGETSRKIGDFTEAFRRFERCLEIYPDNLFAVKGAAESAWEMEDFDLSLMYWQKYVAIRDDEAAVLCRLGDAYRRTGNQRKAEEAYRRTLRQDRDYKYALNGLATILYDLEEYREAVELWKRLLERETKNVFARTSLGNCYRRLREFDSALAAYRAAEQIEPNNFFALYGIADSLRGIGDYTESLEFLRRILEDDPDNHIILTRAGDACRRIGKPDEARKYYRLAVRNRFDLFAEFGLARLDSEEGRYRESIDRLQALTAKSEMSRRNESRIALEISKTYEEAGDIERAVGVLRDTRPMSRKSEEIIRSRLEYLERPSR
jgi:tetratricopeptide (TPR) repeat protein